MWLILIIVLVLFAMYTMCKKSEKSVTPSTSKFNASSTLSSSPDDTKIDNITDDNVLIFHAKWCGHCKNSMPEFIKANKKNSKIILIDSDENPDLVKKYNVKGFPTIMKASGEQFRNTRDAESICDFADS